MNSSSTATASTTKPFPPVHELKQNYSYIEQKARNKKAKRDLQTPEERMLASAPASWRRSIERKMGAALDAQARDKHEDMRKREGERERQLRHAHVPYFMQKVIQKEGAMDAVPGRLSFSG